MDQFKTTVTSISDQNDSDLFIFCGTISDDSADDFIKILRDKPNRRKNCSLILTTFGGDPDAGYRMTKAIRRYYSSFLLYVFGSCKSTGTLIALGSNEIIMSDFGEFGPLDIQLTKEDELSNTSGLSYLQSLTSLNEQIFRSFESNFLSLKQKSGNTITTKTAAEIASKLAVGLIAPISAQLDPVKLGEVQRAIKIADAYGTRLCDDRKIVSRLIAGYPSHGFVIDFEEAQTIFPHVRFVNNEEAILERLLFHLVRKENNERTISDLVDVVNQNSEQDDDEAPDQIDEVTKAETDNTPVHETNSEELTSSSDPKVKSIKRTKSQ